MDAINPWRLVGIKSAKFRDNATQCDEGSVGFRGTVEGANSLRARIEDGGIES